MKNKIIVTEQTDGRFLAHMEGCTETAMGKSAVMALGRLVVHLAATEQIPLDIGLELRPMIGTGMALSPGATPHQAVN